ncbi:MAG: cell division protein ZapB [Acidobacteriota bacterium]
MSTPHSESEMDSLANLEERIRRAVELVATLKEERDAALSDLEEARAAMTELSSFKKTAAEAERLREEINGLRAERKQVRVRIEKLLGQMDQLSGQ